MAQGDGDSAGYDEDHAEKVLPGDERVDGLFVVKGVPHVDPQVDEEEYCVEEGVGVVPEDGVVHVKVDNKQDQGHSMLADIDEDVDCAHFAPEMDHGHREHPQPENPVDEQLDRKSQCIHEMGHFPKLLSPRPPDKFGKDGLQSHPTECGECKYEPPECEVQEIPKLPQNYAW